MVRPAWFVATAIVVTGLTLGLAVATSRSVRPRLPPPGGHGAIDPEPTLGRSTRELYLDAAAAQLLLGGLLVVGLALARVDPGALGLGPVGTSTVALGVGLGVGLGVANAFLQTSVDRLGISYDDRFRRLLSPRTTGEWGLLLGVVLPIVAVYEELLFRGVLVGAAAGALSVSPWPLVGVSAAAFAVGHGLQGGIGLLAAGILGLALGGAFVVTDSLFVVIAAHYVINVLEFLRHRGPSRQPL